MKRIFLLVFLCLPWFTHAAPNPNIILIFADDLGWQEPGFAGSDFCETPNLDRFSSEGMVFRHAYAAAANSLRIPPPPRRKTLPSC
jgi:hypothetical protein